MDQGHAAALRTVAGVLERRQARARDVREAALAAAAEAAAAASRAAALPVSDELDDAVADKARQGKKPSRGLLGRLLVRRGPAPSPAHEEGEGSSGDGERPRVEPPRPKPSPAVLKDQIRADVAGDRAFFQAAEAEARREAEMDPSLRRDLLENSAPPPIVTPPPIAPTKL